MQPHFGILFTQSDLSLIESVQRFACRICVKWKHSTYEDMLIELELPSLQCRRGYLKLCTFFKLCTGYYVYPNLCLSTIRSTSTRSSNFSLRIPLCRVNYYLYSFFLIVWSCGMTYLNFLQYFPWFTLLYLNIILCNGCMLHLLFAELKKSGRKAWYLVEVYWWHIRCLDTHSKESLIEFIQQINNTHSKFSSLPNRSNRSIAFLDVKVTIGEGRLTTDLFTTPTDSHQYLHKYTYSCHPARCKSTIAYNQVLRLRRIYSNGKLTLEEQKKRAEAQQQIDRATNITRTKALTRIEIINTERVPLVVTFHPELPSSGKILCEHLPTLYISEKVKKAVPNPPLVATRRSRNLTNLLVSATMKPPQQLYEANSLCGRPCCKSWVHIQTDMTFESARMEEKFRARATANCRTKNMVYLIKCRKCTKQCIGET